jgi:hypothetical protein
MAVTEIPTHGAAYRVQPLNKDQASQQDVLGRKEKGKKEDKGKKPETQPGRSPEQKEPGRIDLLV